MGRSTSILFIMQESDSGTAGNYRIPAWPLGTCILVLPEGGLKETHAQDAFVWIGSSSPTLSPSYRPPTHDLFHLTVQQLAVAYSSCREGGGEPNPTMGPWARFSVLSFFLLSCSSPSRYHRRIDILYPAIFSLIFIHQKTFFLLFLLFFLKGQEHGIDICALTFLWGPVIRISRFFFIFVKIGRLLWMRSQKCIKRVSSVLGKFVKSTLCVFS